MCVCSLASVCVCTWVGVRVCVCMGDSFGVRIPVCVNVCV